MGRSRLNMKTTTAERKKLCAIKALYIVVYNSPKSIYPLTLELFHTIGNILEGDDPLSLNLNKIDSVKYIETYKLLIQSQTTPQ
jgi:hypothetical protein